MGQTARLIGGKMELMTAEELQENRLAVFEPLAEKTGVPVGELATLPREAIAAVGALARERDIRAYYRAHPGALAAYQRSYRETHKDALREYQRAYRAAHKAEIRADQSRRRAEAKLTKGQAQ